MIANKLLDFIYNDTTWKRKFSY